MNFTVREYSTSDLSGMAKVWNCVVREGNAFPQTEELDLKSAAEFFEGQTFCGVAVDDNSGEVVGMYILRPNNIGRCGHICNASYAVRPGLRGCHIGERLVSHCMEQGRKAGFGILQFNAVVSTNYAARHLYEKLGFVPLGTIPKGFRLDNGEYEDIVVYYHTL